MPRRARDPDLTALLPSWELWLRGEHKAPNTVRTYAESVRRFLSWCEREGRPAVLDRASVAAFIAGLLEQGAEAATANLRHRSLRRFSAWLASEGETPGDALAGMRPPQLDSKIVPKLSPEDLAALLKACDGKRMCDRRDEAIVRLAVEAMCRAEELLSMTVADVDLHRGIATITRGKGGKGRIVPFGSQAGVAIDRYLRARRAAQKPGRDTTALWIGERGAALSYFGLYTGLRRRADRAGVQDFHPHRLRHTGASRWLAAGGSEGGLMAVAGWSSRDMISRYTADTAADRAVDEARRLNLGEL